MGHSQNLATARHIRTMKLTNPDTYKLDGYYEFIDATCETHSVKIGYLHRYNGMYRAIPYREQNMYLRAQRFADEASLQIMDNRRNRQTEMGGFQILEHSIDKNGLVKLKKASNKLDEDLERWSKVYKYNLKAKLLNRGVLDIINDKVTYVSDKEMVEAVIPGIVERIGSISLRSCGSTLKSVVINAPVTHVNRALLYGTPVERVKLYEKTKEIGDYAFYGTAITEIDLPSTVRVIRASAFYNCIKLKTVHFNGPLSYLGKSAFLNCTSLERLRLPNGIFKIEPGTFTGCGSLMYLFIPKSVKELTAGSIHGINPKCKVEMPEHLSNNAIENMYPNVVYY